MYFYESKSSDPLALGQYNGECAKMQQFLCILAHFAHFFTKVFMQIQILLYIRHLSCLFFCFLRHISFLISMQKTEIPCSRSHACLPCDLLCAHIAALRSKKSVSIPPCGKCSVNLGRLRYRLLTAWYFCFSFFLLFPPDSLLYSYNFRSFPPFYSYLGTSFSL